MKPNITVKTIKSPEPIKTEVATTPVLEKKEGNYDDKYVEKKDEEEVKKEETKVAEIKPENDDDECECAHCKGSGKMKKEKKVEPEDGKKEEEEVKKEEEKTPDKKEGNYDDKYVEKEEGKYAKVDMSLFFGKRATAKVDPFKQMLYAAHNETIEQLKAK